MSFQTSKKDDKKLQKAYKDYFQHKPDEKSNDFYKVITNTDYTIHTYTTDSTNTKEDD